MDDLKVESLDRSGWDVILCTRAANGKVLHIMQRSAIISEKKMEHVMLSSSPDEYNCTENMYIDIWRSITSKPK